MDSTDGIQQYMRTLGTWLTSQGHQVDFVAGETKSNLAPNIHSLARNLKVRFNKNELSMPLLASKSAIKQLLENLKPDVIHIQVPYSPVMSGKIIKLAPKSIGLVGTFH